MEAMVHRSYYKRNKNDTRFIIYSLVPNCSRIGKRHIRLLSIMWNLRELKCYKQRVVGSESCIVLIRIQIRPFRVLSYTFYWSSVCQDTSSTIGLLLRMWKLEEAGNHLKIFLASRIHSILGTTTLLVTACSSCHYQ